MVGKTAKSGRKIRGTKKRILALQTTNESGVYLTPEELVERFKKKITLKTLANWRSRGDGPKFTRTGGRILYPLKHVLAWEELRTVESTSQYGVRRD